MIAQFTAVQREPLASLLERNRRQAIEAGVQSGSTMLDQLKAGDYRFSESSGSVELRASNVLGDRDDYILVGALIANTFLAIEHHGVDCELSLLPNGGSDGLLARLTPTVLAPLTDLESKMDAVLSVGGDRAARKVASYLVGCPSVQLLGMLRQAARDSGAWLDIIMDDARKTLVADILATAIHFVNAQRSARDIMVHYGREAPMPSTHRAIVQSALAEIGDAMDGNASVTELQARRAIMRSSLLLVLGTERDTPAEWLRAGIALQRVLLLTAGAGLCASVHAEIVDQPEWRAALGALVFARGKPQIVLHFTPMMSCPA